MMPQNMRILKFLVANLKPITVILKIIAAISAYGSNLSNLKKVGVKLHHNILRIELLERNFELFVVNFPWQFFDT